MRELLVLGCSSRKDDTPGVTPAICRYDGPFYQDFRAQLREKVWPHQLDVAILSARFGLIGALTEIESYDQRMTAERATELAPQVESRLGDWTRKYSRIRICLGKDYLPALPMTEFAQWGRANVFHGPIGEKRRQMREFVVALNAPLRRETQPRLTDRLSYFLPDWDDLLDSEFDFKKDKFSGPKRSRKDRHCARLMRPYKIADGILVSLAQKRDSKGPLKYVGGLDARSLRPLDLRSHYGLDATQSLFGDCGAFSYVNEEEPPFSIRYAVSLYELYNFDFGASVDHIPVTEIEVDDKRLVLSSAERKRRVALTTKNADAFLQEAQRRRSRFVPVGVVQGMSPHQFANNACAYAEMGYTQIALGGLVPLSDEALKNVVDETMKALRTFRRRPSVHLFGVFRPKLQAYFRDIGIKSFDSASYFRKAWLRSNQNYFGTNGTWYSAIRVPITADGRTQRELLKKSMDMSKLETLEQEALMALHKFAKRKLSLSKTLGAVLEYDRHFTRSTEGHSHLARLYELTLRDRPWETCPCPICREAGIHVVVFRGSNRNKRRGAHNTWRLYTLLKDPRSRTSTGGRGTDDS